ncbi:MAG: threonine synthase [Desulfurococcales archaeon]|nr:threonine synthase [Desulfurococcales archaeon]
MSRYIKYLKCSRCGKVYAYEEKPVTCVNNDLGRLDIYYDYEALKEFYTRDYVSTRERRDQWRFFDLLPPENPDNIVSLGEGGTPLLRSERLAEVLGVRRLWLKDETRNPTGSFKDRGMSVSVSVAKEFGYRNLTTASSGNAAAALAAYAAKAGMNVYAFVIEQAGYGKIAQLLFYGANVFRVRGLGKEDPTVKLMRLTYEEYGFFPSPSFGPFNPYQIEGPKTISYEVVEQLGWNVPDYVFVPVGAASLLTGVWKGFRDYCELGLIDRLPHLVAVQSSGNPPFVRAFKEGQDPHNIRPWSKPETIAWGLEDPYPWDGDGGIKALKDSGGFAEEVSDELILKAMKYLAKYEGVFAEPSGAAGLAGLMQALNSGEVRPDEEFVILVTGHGLKDPDIVKEVEGDAPTINPDLREFQAVLRDKYGVSSLE